LNAFSFRTIQKNSLLGLKAYLNLISFILTIIYKKITLQNNCQVLSMKKIMFFILMAVIIQQVLSADPFYLCKEEERMIKEEDCP